MRRMIMTLMGILATCGAASAQIREIEIIPFGGYRWSYGLSATAAVPEIDTKDAAVYGLALDVAFNYKNTATEVYWSHYNGDWEATLLNGDTHTGSFSRDDIMLNGLWYVGSPERPFRPYFTAGLGVAIFDSEEVSATGRFAWNIGGGLRREVNEKIGLRADFRWLPVWMTTGTSLWCDPIFCYTVPSGEFFDQIELSGGLIIKLGSR